MERCTKCFRLRKWTNTGRRDEFGATIRRCVCGQCQAEPPPQGLEQNKRVFYYDIESTKMTIETFGLSVPSKRLSWQSITKPSFLLCWAGAWITSETTVDNIRVYSDSITPKEAKASNDKRCLSVLTECMNKADRWAGHNLKSFDTKVVNTRLIFNHQQAPDFTVKQIDTLCLVKKYFRNDSNSLGYWLQRLGELGKDKMESADWDLCKAGDQKALRKMQKYNRQDVRGGVILLLELRDYLLTGGVDIFK